MVVVLIISLLIVAVAYSAVGHGGASGYLAVLILFGYIPEQLRPLVLTMNIIVTLCLIVRYRFKTEIKPSNVTFLFCIIGISIPAAFFGGGVDIDQRLFKGILGVLLILSAIRLGFKQYKIVDHSPSLLITLIMGVSLGFLSGLTGIGGGVLLSPLLVMLGWFTVKESLPIVSLFILFNSIAGLAGWMSAGNAWQTLPMGETVSFYSIALIGAILGGIWSTKYASNQAIRAVLAGVLLLAGGKMLLAH